MKYLKFLLSSVMFYCFQAGSCKQSSYLDKSVELSLISAVKTGSPIEVQRCLQTKADVHITDEDGSTPLHWACYLSTEKSMDIIEQLLKAGADIHAKDLYGGTPLHWACVSEKQNNSMDVVNRLLKAGADIHAKDIYGYVPLDWIAQYKGSFMHSFMHKI
ncbi:ankyrin repeat domain-containing protein [Candidatus Cardinium hertigii]|jgi:ankyrin repeat protein|uniref:Ankyrin repeat domain-containing protein n=1 Tax=Candidatus Cardinium hertigii TaxID=247481 RepID=A0A3N2QCC6_9BACT|nr:ankyrin repeat domain-containing protein [Candidatus Cardinium hertigii]ROT47473.1 ankyrin repeat domain-containing protein [Candidatus Cardinium hertigii]